MKLGYIERYMDVYADKVSGHRYRFIESPYTIRISSRGKRVYAKRFFPFDFDYVENNTELFKADGLVLVNEPFFLDDDLRKKAVRWVEFANKADPKEFDPFA